jgi:signal recognition particle subunit SRP54
VFNSLSDRLAATFKSLRGRGRLGPADVDATVREIRRALLDADVAVPVVRQFTGRVRERALGAEVSGALNPAQQVVKIVYDELVEVLGGDSRDLVFAKRPPTVILLAGLQGSGKTTLAAKLGYWLREQGHTPLLVAADLQRPGAVKQLQIVGQAAGVPVFAPEAGDGIGDPVDVARRGVAEAVAKLHDAVVIDTAGRLGIDDGLMRQAAQIREATDPDEILFVIDAMIGQDAVTTANAFLDGVGFTGVVLTKLDGDARGGSALSVSSVTGRPILFASTGEKVGDFERFHPDRMASRILDLGDMLTLIEQAQRVFDADQAAEMAAKLAGQSEFTLDDFLDQLTQVRKLGSMRRVIGMMPGAGQYREQLDGFDEREVSRIEAIIRSMTPAERANPKLLNGSRRARIARGSGTTVTEVNQLIQRFDQAKQMMRQVARGRMPTPGMGGKKSKGRMAAPPPPRRKSRSGNPGKRAAAERAAMEMPAPPAAMPKVRGGAFGLAGRQPGPTAESANSDRPQLGLPPGLGGLVG